MCWQGSQQCAWSRQPRAPARDCPASTPCHDWRRNVLGRANSLQQHVDTQAPQWAVPADPLLSPLLLGSAPGLPNHPWVLHGFPSLTGGQLHASRLTEQGNGPQGAGKGLGRERPGEQRSAGLPQPRPWPTPSPSPRTSKLGRCRMRSQRGRPGRVRTKGAMPCEYSRLCLFMLRMCSLISFPGAPPRTLK